MSEERANRRLDSMSTPMSDLSQVLDLDLTASTENLLHSCSVLDRFRALIEDEVEDYGEMADFPRGKDCSVCIGKQIAGCGFSEISKETLGLNTDYASPK